MKTSILILAALTAFTLPSCSSAPKPVDPFDAALGAAIGGIASGFSFPNEGAAL